MAAWAKSTLSTFDLERLIIRLLETVEVFSGFTQTELIDLLSNAEKCVFNPRDIILTEGSAGHFMYVIIDGEVEIRKKLAVGGEKVLKNLGSGSCFGEMALVDNEVRSATVKSVKKCIMLRIGESDFWKNPLASAKFYRNIARLLSQRLRDNNAMIALAYFESTPTDPDPCQKFDPVITQRNFVKR
jgi:CRP-like cAMP-binding protein